MPVFSILIFLIGSVLLIGIVNISIAKLLAYPIIVIVNTCNAIVTTLSELSIGTLYIGRLPLVVIFLFYTVWIGVILGIIYSKYRKPLFSYSALVVLGFAILNLVPSKFEITQLYVGQGDCSVVRTPNNKIILIDGGVSSSATRIQNHLWHMGINTIDLAIVSHADSDHIGGILELLRRNHPIKTVVIPNVDIEDTQLIELLALCKVNEVEVIEAKQSDSFELDNVAMNIIAPEINPTNSDKNENSLVFELVYKDFKMLYTGDIGKSTEAKLNKHLTDVDVLKVAHHGSGTSTDDYFLQTITPQYAIISCGVNNMYAHPKGETLEALDNAGVKVVRTDLGGAIKITLNNGDIVITTHIN
ncbi:MAG: hypothetical protein ATN33_05010 [Epulopiscium sp. Nele67-Bin001]|nr:MAG: hypothetical protein ATN33_05010 [Epulopiscium sp. Nele67-Bin001]